MKERLGGGNNEKVRRAEGGKQMKAEEERGGGGERGLVEEKPKIKNKQCLKTWPIGRFGRVRIQVRPKYLQLGLGHMQSLQYDSWSNDMVPNN